MEEKLRVVVYGNSLSMAGIAASLKTDASLEVITLNPHLPGVQQQLRELNPAVIAFDLSDTTPGLDFRLIPKCPGMLLIGVDISKDDLLVLSSHTLSACSVVDLVNVIRQKKVN